MKIEIETSAFNGQVYVDIFNDGTLGVTHLEFNNLVDALGWLGKEFTNRNGG